MGRRSTYVVLGLAVALLSSSVWVIGASAQDLSVRLADVESRAASAEAEIPRLETSLAPARASFAASSRRARPVQRAARSAQARVRELKADSVLQQRAATTRIAEIESVHQEEVDSHDKDVSGGIGFALAALLAGAIALAWGWFRATPVVAWLTEQQLGQAIGLCVFGGLILVIVGGAMLGSSGLVGALGTFVAFTGFVLPIALLLARHSAQVQRGRAAPLSKRERMPRWVTRAIGATMAILVLVGFASALFADSPEPGLVSATLRDQADPAGTASSAAQIAAAEDEADALSARAATLTARQRAAGRAFAHSRNALDTAESRLAAARSGQSQIEDRLEARAAQEEREATRVAEREQRELVKAEEEATSACDPNYAGACLDPYASDYDCEGGSGDGPLYTGPVEVVGYDHYGLDSNSNGYGCE